MKLTLVLGPMFAGKTSFIINKFHQEHKLFKDIIALKPTIDNRYSDNEIVSHNDNLKSIPALIVDDLNQIEKTFLDNFDIILIDEGQFFKNLNLWIRKMENFSGEIIISALNGDFKRQAFGEINLLISRADNLIFLQGQCHFCSRSSSFSLKKTIVKSSTSQEENQIEVGGNDKYVPVCGSCYCLQS